MRFPNNGEKGLYRKGLLPLLEPLDVVFESSTTSNVVDCGGTSIVGFLIPSDFVGTSVTFKFSVDGVTFVDIYNSSGTQETMTVGAADSYIALVPIDLFAARFLKLVSDQSEDTTVTAMTKRVS